MITNEATLKREYLRGFGLKILIILANTCDLWRRITQSLSCQAEEAYLQTVCQKQREGLPQIIHENPILFWSHPQRKQLVEWLTLQIQRGVIPGLIELAAVFPAEQDTPQVRQLLNRFHHFLGQAGKLGNQRGQQLRLALSLCSRKNKLRELKKISTTPNTRQALENKIQALNALIHETENALIQLLSTDPCIGDSIHLDAHQQAYPRWLQKPLRWLDSARTLRPNQVH
jgi:hypothetical protein